MADDQWRLAQWMVLVMDDEQETSPQETAKAYAAFLEYCALGRGRSLPKLAQKFGESSEKVRSLQRLYERWSSQHKWQERVKQYDAEIIADRAAKKQAKREDMEDRHAKEAKEEQEWARAVLESGKDRDYISLAAVQLLKNSREDERKALTEEETPRFEPGTVVGYGGVIVYLPQKVKLPLPKESGA